MQESIAHNGISRNKLIDFIRMFHDEEDEKLTLSNFMDHPEYPSSTPIYNRFESWNDALEKAGLSNDRPHTYTRDEMLDELRRFKSEHGQIKSEDFKQHPDYPGIKPIYRIFGSWNEALNKAGIEINRLRVSDLKSGEDEMKSKAYVIGVLFGDGYITTESEYPVIGLGVTDKEFAEEFGARLCKWLGADWYGFNSDKTQVSCRAYNSNHTNSKKYKVEKGITSIATSITDYYDKSISDILSEFNGVEEHLVRGMWDSEGCIDKENGTIKFSNTEKKVIRLYIKALSRCMKTDFEDEVSLDNTDIASIDSAYMSVPVLEPGNYNSLKEEFYEVKIPRLYCNEFYDVVNPTIRRKREVFRMML